MGRTWAAVLVFAVLAGGCGSTVREPRAVRPESDVCPACRMTVIPGGYAAESVASDGTILVFDDPGCLALYALDHPNLTQEASFFVQDAETRDWIPWDSASFVRADEVSTPMNYGWHGFATQARARAFSTLHPGSRVVFGQSLAALQDDLKGRRWSP